MKKIVIILIAFVFMMIGGCQKKNASTKDSGQTNDFYTEIIKEDILSNNTNTNLVANSNENLTEPIAGAVSNKPAAPQTAEAVKSSMKAVSSQKSIPVEPEVGEVASIKRPTVKTPSVKTSPKPEKHIKDEAIEVPASSKQVSVSGKGSYAKIGNDAIGQGVSPRKRIKLTAAAFTSLKEARYVDFSVFALPKGKELKLSYYYQIASMKNIEVINGQAQLTKYWNGRNLDGEFLPQGNYNIYIMYVIKDPRMNELKKESRYWGLSEKYYIKLY